MKKLLLSLLFIVLAITTLSAQNDTVCAGATGVSYWLNGAPGSTYSWTINGGSQASGGTTDSITIDFLSTTGIDTIEVLETDSNGCFGEPVKLAVVRMPVPTATISAGTATCFEDSVNITVNLTGTLPWSLTYNDGSGNITVNNISSSPYVFNTGSLSTSTTYTLVEVVDRLTCTTALSGAGTVSPVTVYPQVITPAIQHN